MSNNNASSNLIIAQRAVKQLRFEANIRRIKVRTLRWNTNTEDFFFQSVESKFINY